MSDITSKNWQLVIRILSYNVNGIRAALNKDFLKWLSKEDPDILCIQETKALSGQLPLNFFNGKGYHEYWNSAEKKGYSGVLILSKTEPSVLKMGMGIEKFDREGRVIRADYPGFTLVNVYIPSGTTGDIRQDFKMEFLSGFRNYLDKLREEKPALIVCGDFNICHKHIDINHPERHKNSSGFLPEEREWVDRLVESGFIDTFREFIVEPNQYSWWSYRANSREKNLGWRIDYHMLTPALRVNLHAAGIMKDATHSDHCPVWIELND